MFCNQCSMVIHESEIKWVLINEEEIPFCPVHRESLNEQNEKQ